MWQRIQTLYLALVSLLYFLLLFIPIANFKGDNFELKFNLIKTVKVYNNMQETVAYNVLLVIFSTLIIATSLFCIYQFKNRKFQIKLTGLLFLLNAAFLVIEYFLQENLSKQFSVIVREYLAGSYIPLVALAFVFLAQRSIKKDEELVRSADRLR